MDRSRRFRCCHAGPGVRCARKGRTHASDRRTCRACPSRRQRDRHLSAPVGLGSHGRCSVSAWLLPASGRPGRGQPQRPRRRAARRVPARHGAPRGRDPAGHGKRINYEILGNSEPELHAHVFPRYATESPELRRLPAWFYDWAAAPRYVPEAHPGLRDALRSALLG